MQNSDPLAVVKTALEFFRSQGFVYSLSPGQYEGAAALDDFLFRRKIGFCEHYAGTFATLMRAAGIPSRVVVGYLGGQFNQFGNYLLVRQSDAHAWCEVWLPDAGWVRVDPTSVIAPERLSLGSLREMRAAAAQGSRRSGESSATRDGTVGRVLDDARLAWDSVNFAWDTRVLAFDQDAQREILTRIRIDGWSGGLVLFSIAAVSAGLLCLYGVWIRWRARARSDPLRSLYDQFCEKAGQLGASRHPAEGPANYAERAAALIPQQADRIRKITASYIALRYSRGVAATSRAHLAADVRAFGRGIR